MNRSSSRKKNKSGNYQGIPSELGKLYYCKKVIKDTDKTISTTQLATPYYDQTKLQYGSISIPNLEIQNFKPKYDTKLDRVDVILNENNDHLVDKGNKYLQKLKKNIKFYNPNKRIKEKQSKIIKQINQVKSFYNEGMYNPTRISKKLKLSREFTKDVLDSLHIGENPEDKIVNLNQRISTSEELLIKTYFEKEKNIGKSIKALSFYINEDKKRSIPNYMIKKILRKTGIRYIKRNIWKKNINQMLVLIK